MTHKRKQFWVDPPLQFQMIAVIMALVVSSLALVSFSVLHGLHEASVDSKQIFHSLDWVNETVRGPLILSTAISLLASILITVVWSHRFAGPLRVLSAGVQRLKQGNLSIPMRIRRMDTHQDLIHEFSSMQDALRKIVESDRQAAAQAAKELRKLDLEKLAVTVENLGAGFKL